MMRHKEHTIQTYSEISKIPHGHAGPDITPGCIVLEGGAFRGLYNQGVLDALMKNDINFACTIGTSAGALAGFSYTAGQIGRSARVNLTYRHHPDYVGVSRLEGDMEKLGSLYWLGYHDTLNLMDSLREYLGRN